MRIFLAVLFFALCGWGSAQSIELMPGTENVFVDLQWLKNFDKDFRFSLFSRTRATVDYNDNTSLFTGAYLNYTTRLGLGPTLVGRMDANGAAGDMGLHFFKASPNYLVFALAAVEPGREVGYSWFSIMRYTPAFSETWKLYSSLELFTGFRRSDHLVSVQRLRLGLDWHGYQFGMGLNLLFVGEDFSSVDPNPGVFLRKQF